MPYYTQYRNISILEYQLLLLGQDYMIKNILLRVGFSHFMGVLVFNTTVEPQQTNTAKKPPRCLSNQVKLGKAAQADVTEWHRAAAAGYSLALKELWSKIKQEMESIAVEHHKSIRKVSNDVHMGSTVSLGKHSKISPWNVYIWKEHVLEKENQTDTGSDPHYEHESDSNTILRHHGSTSLTGSCQELVRKISEANC